MMLAEVWTRTTAEASVRNGSVLRQLTPGEAARGWCGASPGRPLDGRSQVTCAVEGASECDPSNGSVTLQLQFFVPTTRRRKGEGKASLGAFRSSKDSRRAGRGVHSVSNRRDAGVDKVRCQRETLEDQLFFFQTQKLSMVVPVPVRKQKSHW